MCHSLIEIGSKTAEKNSAQTNKQTERQTNRHYENNRHFAVNQKTRISGESNTAADRGHVTRRPCHVVPRTTTHGCRRRSCRCYFCCCCCCCCWRCLDTERTAPRRRSSPHRCGRRSPDGRRRHRDDRRDAGRQRAPCRRVRRSRGTVTSPTRR